MIDIEYIRREPELAKANLARRGVNPEEVENLRTLDAQWRALKQAVDELRSEQKNLSQAVSETEGEKRDKLLKLAKEAANRLKKQEEDLSELETKRQEAWVSLPNLVGVDVPDGGEEDFIEIDHGSVAPSKDENQRHYLDLVGDLIDIERAAKVSGSRFAYLRGELVWLEFALVRLALETASHHGFIPVIPPVLIKPEAMSGMGYLDHEGDEVYRTQDDLYLAGTSEQPLGAMHMGEVIEAQELPFRYVGFSSCFRREAGSHGKDVKGILRVHQFDKIELFSIAKPKDSSAEHENILSMQKSLMDVLRLPYRVINIATNDLGAPAAKKYDIETWLPGEQRYRETSSTSNTTDYQSRRLNIRFREDDMIEFVHMVNGTAFAIGRMLIAIIENYQQTDGSIAVPDALKPMVPFESIKKAAEGGHG